MKARSRTMAHAARRGDHSRARWTMAMFGFGLLGTTIAMMLA